MRIHSKGLHQQQQVLLTYPFKTYPTNTYPCYAYPCNAYPFKGCASAGIANVSHQYISHQYVSVQHVSHQYGSIQCVSMQKVCISRNGNEYEYHCMSFHTIAIGRNGNKNRNLAFPSISLQFYLLNTIVASYWPACLPSCALALIIFRYSIPPGGMGRVNRKATLPQKRVVVRLKL